MNNTGNQQRPIRNNAIKSSANTSNDGAITKRHQSKLSVGKYYLIFYNSVIFAGFVYVYATLITNAITQDTIYLDSESINHLVQVVRILTWTQHLECVHPLLGLVPGGPFLPFTQLLGRFFIVLFLFDRDLQTVSAPWIWCLFCVWSSIEVIRYPYYALRVAGIELSALTWLRYSLFLPLYPCGGICETMVMLHAAQYFEGIKKYMFELPNKWNISLSLPFCVKFFAYVLLNPTILLLMKYMWSQRRKQLSPTNNEDKRAKKMI